MTLGVSIQDSFPLTGRERHECVPSSSPSLITKQRGFGGVVLLWAFGKR